MPKAFNRQPSIGKQKGLAMLPWSVPFSINLLTKSKPTSI
ncbi:hypothetical protein Lpp225_0268 [Lacticaseibacillus paracasei subsp. paracasei Lpp225]|uniref:Uncharacterized protein n=2 Tax=Lacticaseibacillus paracasei subsp. paracasei TaxID=47714 RepID=S2NHJ3_LACPA|nr:hypothetical protein Lpp17_0698 [Lacticaseibacillus paracasei subsp. paracasei Lpp17]EPC39365.1 hypothetical protein Lpp225_0268 [Lacticaseibacillus paracasei subsp. paracasei Lpp225]OUC71483.1 hypothetical protein BWK52_1537c [Lacticaseibacillus paracasei]QGV17979.1 Hypothetical protein LCAKO_1454 [Lacticaseibacillus paracasei subsp. paracasei]QHV92214.1 hypothetical protein EOK76_g1770 [Lacticaseibacillus paracasei]